MLNPYPCKTWLSASWGDSKLSWFLLRGCWLLLRLLPSLRGGATSQLLLACMVQCVLQLSIYFAFATELCWSSGKKWFPRQGDHHCMAGLGVGMQGGGQLKWCDSGNEQGLGGGRKLCHGRGQTWAGTTQRMDSLAYHRCNKIFVSLSNSTEKQHYIYEVL